MRKPRDNFRISSESKHDHSIPQIGENLSIRYGFKWKEIKQRSMLEWFQLWVTRLDQYRVGQEILEFGKKMEDLEDIRNQIHNHYKDAINNQVAMENMWRTRQEMFIKRVEVELDGQERTKTKINHILSQHIFFVEMNNIMKLKTQDKLLRGIVAQYDEEMGLVNRRIESIHNIISALDEHLTKIEIIGVTNNTLNTRLEDVYNSVRDVARENDLQEESLKNMGNTLKNIVNSTRVVKEGTVTADDRQNFNDTMISAIMGGNTVERAIEN